MSKYFKSLVVLVFGISLIFCFGSHTQKKQEEKYYPYWHQRATLFHILPDTEDEIIFLGDSITDGCNWGEMLHDLRVKNRGINGDVTDGVIERLDEVVESFPLKIFLMIGINDLANGKTIEYIVNNIKRIVKTIQKKSPDTKIYLESLLPVNPDFDMFENYTNKRAEVISINKSLKKISKVYGITYIDLYSLFETEDNKLNPEYTNDGLHLKGAGYLVWKSVIEDYIK